MGAFSQYLLPGESQTLMRPFRPVAEGILVIMLVLVSLATGGCGPAGPDMAPELVYDPQDYVPIDVPEPSAHWQGEMAGEVTQDSVILQARLTKDGRFARGTSKAAQGSRPLRFRRERNLAMHFARAGCSQPLLVTIS
jgi:hypothetical protein